MKYQYRNDARIALSRAKAEIASGESHRLRYAALELRMALEALTYDRAQMYQDELPPSECDIWQPGKLLKVLMEIEPLVNVSTVIRYKKEASATSPEGDWKELGDDTVIPMKVVNKYHNALGSSLHMSTMRQLENGQAFDAPSVKAKCDSVIAEIEKALASKVQANFGDFGRFECMKCGAVVRKRLSVDTPSLVATCYGNHPGVICGAQYGLVMAADGHWGGAPMQSRFSCPASDCDHEFVVWQSEVKEQASWTCPKCSSEIEARLCVSVAKPRPNSD